MATATGAPLRHLLLRPTPTTIAAHRFMTLATLTNSAARTHRMQEYETSTSASGRPTSDETRPTHGPLCPEAEKAARRVLEGHLRVDHAGEWGAVRIYEGQLAVLGKTAEGHTLREMCEHERGHLKKFNELLPKYRVRPTALLPLWDVAGFALGVGSALMGKEAAYAVTVAVETVITEHYNDQLRILHQDKTLKHHKELRDTFRQFRDEEQEHLDTGLQRNARQAPFYKTITNVVHAGCTSAIWLAKRV